MLVTSLTLVAAALLWFGVPALPRPFPVVGDNRSDDWLRVERALSRDPTYVLSDGSRWVSDVANQLCRRGCGTGLRAPTTEYVVLRTAGETTLMDVWSDAWTSQARTWNPFAPKSPRWVLTETLPVRRAP